MTIQVLVATMNQTDTSLLKKMNIQSDAIIGNQCDRNSIEHCSFNQHEVTYLNFNERGVGLNRNNCLLRATADYCVIADDDMVFYDNYIELIERAFNQKPDADFLIFNIDERGDTIRRRNNGFKRVRLFNYMNYGAARFVFNRAAITNKAITFNLNFGGGTAHSCGEDTLFLRDCLSKKIKIYTAPYSLAFLTEERESSWFAGYNEKFFYDKGYLLAIAHPVLCKFMAKYLFFRHKEFFENNSITKREAMKILLRGVRDAKRNTLSLDVK